MLETVTRYFCDECGEQLEDDDHPAPLYGHTEVTVTELHPSLGEFDSYEYHVCHDCTPEMVYNRCEGVEVLYDITKGTVVSLTYTGGGMSPEQLEKSEFDGETYDFSGMVAGYYEEEVHED